MPPKPVLTKEKILDAAFEMVREQGIEILTARSIAQRLKCSTRPIYSVYGSMDEVIDDVFNRAIDFVFVSMQQFEDEENSVAMDLAIGSLLFFQDEKQLFRTLFLSNYRRSFLERNKDRLNEEFYAAFLQTFTDEQISKISESKFQEMYLRLHSYWLGIGTKINNNELDLDIDEVTDMIDEMYQMLMNKEGLVWKGANKS